VRCDVFFDDRAALREWLSAHHGREVGIWAHFYKASTGRSDLSWEALVEECLCFGWIDSLPGKVDDLRTKVYIAPRKPRSGWSRRNKFVVAALQERGLMAAPGTAAIERAKTNGSWERFDLAESLVVPAELSAELDTAAEFQKAWSGLTEARQRQFLQQIYDARTPATRARRIAQIKEGLCGLPPPRSN
jgi:uncharacterized protein YdeI (YjbR/CyaY-like superfamily)